MSSDPTTTAASLRAENDALRSQLATVLRDHTPQRDGVRTYCAGCHNGALDAARHGSCDTYNEVRVVLNGE